MLKSIVKYIVLTLITLLSSYSYSQTALPVSGTSVGSSTGSWIVPSNVYSITINSWGGGGAGAGRSTTGTGGMAGGAGGSISTTTISVTPGQIIYFNIASARAGTTGNATNGNDTWINKSSNSAPTTSSNGVVAKGGQSAVGTTAGLGSTTGCVGTSFNRGGNGRLGGVTSGGGGSSAGNSLNGTDATGTTGAIAPTGGGNGGSGANTTGGNGSTGVSPGGGGGGAYKNSTTSRTGGSGAAGRVILTYTAIPNCATIVGPSNGQSGVSTASSLNWNSVSGATSYDVYFGTTFNPPFVINQTGTSYSPSLNNSTLYYWKVVAKNSAGDALSCSTWSFTTKDPGCLSATYGQYPASVFNPSCPGTPENITTVGYASEYSMVTLISGVNYTFGTSVSTDFITISDELGTTVLAYGVGSVSYTCLSDGDYRFYLHTNGNCGSSTVTRSRTIQCSTPPPPSNDLIANAQNVGLCGGTFNNNTKFATQSGDGPSCYNAAGENWTSPGVWYTVVGNGQNITASLCGSNYDTKIFIYTGSPGNLTCLTYNDDFCGTRSEVTFSSTLNTTYYILVTGYGSSKGAFTLNVTLSPSNPIISTQPTSGSVCIGQSRTFSVVSSGNQGPLSYQWYLGGVAISGANSTSYTSSTAGTYYVIVSNSCGASSQSNSAILTVNPLPNITVTSPEVCNGFSTTVTASGGTSYVWSNGSTGSSISVSPASTTNYNVTGTDVNGCQNVATATVTVNPNPTVSLNSLTSTICAGGSGTNNIIATPSSGTPIYNYQWQYFTGTTWINTGTNSNTLNATPTSTRQYRVIVTDSKGCQVTSQSHTVNVVPDPINPTLNTKNPNQTDICVGTSVSATFNPGTGGVSCGDVYQFSTNSGSTWATYTSGNNISTSGLAQGTTVQIRGRRSNCATGIGCSSNTWDILSQWSIVTPPILSTSTNTISCSGGGNGSINLTVSGSVGPFSFNWTGPNGFTSNLEDITNLSAGSYIVVVTTPSGCSATTSVTVSEPSQLVLTLAGGDALCSGSSNGSIDLTVTGGSPTYTYSWSNGQTTEDLNNLSAGTYTVNVTDMNSCVATSSVTISQPSTPVSVSGTYTNVLCNGGNTGSIDITTTGGTPGYTYSWSNGQTTEDISGLTSGSYMIIVTDNNGCSSNTVFNITEPTPITSTISSVDVDCFGSTTGSLSISTSGGTTPYSYLWSNGQTGNYIYNLAAGSYSVTITDGNGCISTNTKTITQPTQIVISTSNVNVSCNGQNTGSISVTATGGTPPYTYNWTSGQTTPNISNLYSGNYTIFVSDSKGCTKSQMVNISQPSPISISVNNPTISTCQTTPVTLTANVTGGTPGYTYLWSNGSTSPSISVLPTTTTQYTVTVTDIKGCVNTNISTITVTPLVNLTPIGAVTGPTQAYPYMINSTIATYSVNPVPGATNYTWYIPNNGVFFVTNSDSNVVNVQINQNFAVNSNGGDFYVKVTNACGVQYSDTLHVDVLQNPNIIGDQCGIPASSIKTYYVSNSVSGLTYNWTPPYGAVILSGQGNDTCKVKYSYSFQNSPLSVYVSTIFGNFYGYLDILRNASIPNSINGPTEICADGLTSYEYYVDSVSTATGYIWGLPTGVTLLDGQLNDTIHVTFSPYYTGGSFNVQAYNQCGSSPMRYGAVQNQNQTLSAGTIIGPTDLCPYIGSSATFSVTNIPGFTYSWTTPSGVSIISGQGTSQVQLSIPYGFTSGQLSVKMNDGCGFTNSSLFNMTTVQQSISVSNITGLTNPCYIVGTNQSTTYSIGQVANSTYSWSVPSNCQIVSGQGTNSIQVKYFSGFVSGVISVTVSPNCGVPVTRSRTIQTSYPSMNIGGYYCIENNQSYTYSINLSNQSSYNIQSWNWTVPGNAVITSGQGTSSIVVFYPQNFEIGCVNNLCDSIRCFVQFPCGTKKVAMRIGMTTYPVTTITGPSSVCGPDTIQLSTSTSPRATTYLWGAPNGTQFISINGIPTTPNLSQTVNSKINTTFLGGNYNVQSINQCGSTAMRYFYVSKLCPSNFIINNNDPELIETQQSIVTIDDIFTSVDYNESLLIPMDFIVYPNPGKDKINLRVFRGDSEYYNVSIYNLLSQRCYFSNHKSSDILDVSKLTEGVFFISVESEDGYSVTKQLVIER